MKCMVGFFLSLYLESPQKPEKQIKKTRHSVQEAAICAAASRWGCLSTGPAVASLFFFQCY